MARVTSNWSVQSYRHLPLWSPLAPVPSGHSPAWLSCSGFSPMVIKVSQSEGQGWYTCERKAFLLRWTFTNTSYLKLWFPKLCFFVELFFFLKFLEDMSPFCGATDTPVLDFWWCLSWVSKPGLIPRLRALSPVCHEFLRFTSGATPADCIEVGMAASCVPYMLHM